jgi:hypothetical protein
MSLREQIRVDLRQAMKQGDTLRVSTLRHLSAALQNREIAKRSALDDDEVVESIVLATKQRRESIAFAQQYGREAMAQQEQGELAILEAYLPTPLRPEEIMQRIEAVVQELGATLPKDLGRVMQALMPAVKGRADGQMVNRLVRERLEQPRQE